MPQRNAPECLECHRRVTQQERLSVTQAPVPAHSTLCCGAVALPAHSVAIFLRELADAHIDLGPPVAPGNVAEEECRNVHEVEREERHHILRVPVRVLLPM